MKSIILFIWNRGSPIIEQVVSSIYVNAALHVLRSLNLDNETDYYEIQWFMVIRDDQEYLSFGKKYKINCVLDLTQ